MKKTWLIIIILVIAGIVGFFVFKSSDQKEVIQTNSPTSTTSSETTKSTNEKAIHFSCANNRSFDAVFKQPTVEITLDNKTKISLEQSTSSPHLFESSNSSFYVEGDEASLQTAGQKYDNCAAQNV